MNNTYSHEVFTYNGVIITPQEISKNKIMILVSGDQEGGGKTIAVTVQENMFDDEGNLLIEYDGEAIEMADNIIDIMNPNDDGLHAEYLLTVGADGVVMMLFSIPHFSEHTISITSIAQVVEALGGVTAIILYLAIIGLVALVYVVPIWVYRRK
jgi:hypothetical protein